MANGPLAQESGLGGIWAVNQQRSDQRKPNLLDKILGLYGADPSTHIPEGQRNEALRRGLLRGGQAAAAISGRGHDRPTLGQHIANYFGAVGGTGEAMGQEQQGLQMRQMLSQALSSGEMTPERIQAIMGQLVAMGTPEALAQAQMLGEILKTLPKPGEGQFTLGEDERRFDASGNLIAAYGKGDGSGSLRLDDMIKQDTGDYIQYLDPDTGDIVRSYAKGDSGQLRGDFRADTKDFATVAEGVQTIESAFKDPSAAGDLAGIFAFMKVLDPGSVVRESEFANAQNAAGVPERVRALYNRVLAGERLSPETRKDFLGRARRIAAGRQEQLRGIMERYEDIADRMGVDKRNVVYDYFGNFDFLNEMTPAETPPTPAPAAPVGPVQPMPGGGPSGLEPIRP